MVCVQIGDMDYIARSHPVLFRNYHRRLGFGHRGEPIINSLLPFSEHYIRFPLSRNYNHYHHHRYESFLVED